jgi:two-component system phosphate regulon response regulator PhoB
VNAVQAEKSRILIVEDEDGIRNLLALHLKREGHDVDAVKSSEDAQKMLRTQQYGLLVLDWMLPGESGVNLAKEIRAKRDDDIPILMVTAKSDANDIVFGLESGADDYLTKPFDTSVLVARVRALLRRIRRSPAVKSESAEIRLGDLIINGDTVEVICAGEKLSLTASEFKLLYTMAKNRGRVLTRDSLIAQVQGEGVAVVGRTIDTHVFGLRKKLGVCGDLIETVRGIGYRVRAEQ